MPEGTPPDFFGWLVDRGGSPLGEVPYVDDRIDDLRAQSVFGELSRLDVDPAIAAELATIRPGRTYVVIATVRGGSGRAGRDDGGRKMPMDQNQIVLQGRGQALWNSFMHLADPDAGGSELLDVEVIEARTPGKKDEAWPVWEGESAEAHDGRTIEGTGSRPLWEAYRATEGRRKGRRKKSGGGMTAAERRKEKAATRARDKRRKKSRAKAQALRASGKDIAASRYETTVRKLRSGGGKKKPKRGKGRTR